VDDGGCFCALVCDRCVDNF